MKRFFLWLLPLVASKLPKNRGKSYPQLWYFMPRRKGRGPLRCTMCRRKVKIPKEFKTEDQSPGRYVYCDRCGAMALHGESKENLIGFWLAPLLERLCGRLTGHELSKTEWGYGGGKHTDRHCRWCDKLIRVPLAEDPPPTPELEDLAGLL